MFQKKVYVIFCVVGVFLILVVLLPAIILLCNGTTSIDYITLGTESLKSGFEILKILIGIGLGVFLYNYVKESESKKARTSIEKDLEATCNQLSKLIEYIQKSTNTISTVEFNKWKERYIYFNGMLQDDLTKLSHVSKSISDTNLYLIIDNFTSKIDILNEIISYLTEGKWILPLSEIPSPVMNKLNDIKTWLENIIKILCEKKK